MTTRLIGVCLGLWTVLFGLFVWQTATSIYAWLLAESTTNVLFVPVPVRVVNYSTTTHQVEFVPLVPPPPPPPPFLCVLIAAAGHDNGSIAEEEAYPLNSTWIIFYAASVRECRWDLVDTTAKLTSPSATMVDLACVGLVMVAGMALAITLCYVGRAMDRCGRGRRSQLVISPDPYP